MDRQCSFRFEGFISIFLLEGIKQPELIDMIHNIYILRSNGVCIFHEKYGSLDEEPQAIAGFLTALSMFTSSTVGEPIRDIKTQNYKFTYHFDSGLTFVAFTDKADSFETIQNFLMNTKYQFYQRYPDMKSPSSNYNLAVLESFRPDLEILIQTFEQQL